MTQKRRRRLWKAVQQLRHRRPMSIYQCRNAGVSRGRATSAGAKRSSVMGNSRAPIAPSTAMVGPQRMLGALHEYGEAGR